MQKCILGMNFGAFAFGTGLAYFVRSPARANDTPPDYRIVLGAHKCKYEKRAPTIELRGDSADIRMGDYAWAYQGPDPERFLAAWLGDMFMSRAVDLALLDDDDNVQLWSTLYHYDRDADLRRFLARLKAGWKSRAPPPGDE